MLGNVDEEGADLNLISFSGLFGLFFGFLPQETEVCMAASKMNESSLNSVLAW